MIGSSPRHRWSRLAFWTVAAAVVLSGCTPSTLSTPSTSNTPGPRAFDQQTPEWLPCFEQDADLGNRSADDFLCTIVDAPLDWDNPTAATEPVQLSLMKVAASSETPRGAVFVNPGGPGEGGVDLALSLALEPSFQPIAEQHDLIGFDPRGIGDSTPLQCAESANESFQDQLAECLTQDPLAHYIGTASVAKDMELLRQVLGYDAVSYLGYSYGTVLGATYAHLFPQRVDKMVLDSAETATWSGPLNNYDQQLAMIAAVGSLAATCPQLLADAAAACPFDSSQSFEDFIEGLDATPWQSSDGDITGQAVLGYLNSSLYADAAAQEEAMRTIAQAAADNATAIKKIGQDSTSVDVDIAGAIIGCHSVPPESDPAQLRDHLKRRGGARLVGRPRS